MTSKTSTPDIDFPFVFNDRGRDVLERFGQYTFEDVTNPKLVKLVHEIQNYWYDTFRPALTSFACETVGGEPNSADTASLMIALAGAGIGVHDDIIDASTTKHTRKTILENHSKDEALIVGDLFIVKGLTLGRNLLRDTLDPIIAVQVIALLDQFFTQLCEGELMEISYRNTIETSLNEYNNTLWKLGCCLEACTRIGGLMGGGSQTDVDALGNYGGHLGFVVRLAEEVKDTFNMGGNLAHRLQYESVPLPIIYAANVNQKHNKELEMMLEKQSFTLLESMRILKLCYESGAFAYVQKVVDKSVKCGLHALNNIETGGKASAESAKQVLALVLKTTFPII
ncbi:MAG: polyprenyl synthetase family protein [Candidatus Kariarchaeaceae archaeon]|jgi:geranylgeranyl pyrophosphate synthase